MSKKRTVTAAFRDPQDAAAAFDHLRSMGYPDSAIDLMVSDQTYDMYFSEKKAKKKGTTSGSLMEEGAGVGGAIGTATGAALGALLAIGTTVVMPGLNLVIAGPLAGALAGAGAGAATGGVIGALTGYGYPEADVHVYEEVLHGGGVVMGIHPTKNDDESELKNALKEYNGEQVCVVNI